MNDMSNGRRIALRVARIAAGGTLFLLIVLATLARADLPRAEVDARYANATSRFLVVDGVRVHYRDEGQGPPLLLLHGTSSSLHTWDAWTRVLAANRRVVRLDMPGFGLTGPAEDRDYGVARLARTVVALLDALHVEQVDIGGNSLGGRVALQIALDHPARVGKLVLVSSVGLPGLTLPVTMRLGGVPVLNNLLRFVTPSFVVAHNVADVYGDPARVDDATVRRYEAMLRRAGNRDALVDRLAGPTDPTLEARLGEIRAPTLIQWGERDAWIPVAHGREMHRLIRGSALRIYEGAGHVSMEEIPDMTVRDAQAFLDGGLTR